MSTCKLCGKELSEASEETLCTDCQGMRESIVQEQRLNVAAAKKNRREILYIVLAVLLLIFIVKLATQIGDGKAEAAAEHAVQELIFAETGQTLYFKSSVEYRTPISSFVVVRYSTSKEEMKRGVFSYRLVNVLNSNVVDNISEECPSSVTETP